MEKIINFYEGDSFKRIKIVRYYVENLKMALEILKMLTYEISNREYKQCIGFHEITTFTNLYSRYNEYKDKVQEFYLRSGVDEEIINLLSKKWGGWGNEERYIKIDIDKNIGIDKNIDIDKRFKISKFIDKTFKYNKRFTYKKRLKYNKEFNWVSTRVWVESDIFNFKYVNSKLETTKDSNK